jgi:hypothetical protein
MEEITVNIDAVGDVGKGNLEKRTGSLFLKYKQGEIKDLTCHPFLLSLALSLVPARQIDGAPNFSVLFPKGFIAKRIYRYFNSQLSLTYKCLYDTYSAFNKGLKVCITCEGNFDLHYYRETLSFLVQEWIWKSAHESYYEKGDCRLYSSGEIVEVEEKNGLIKKILFESFYEPLYLPLHFKIKNSLNSGINDLRQCFQGNYLKRSSFITAEKEKSGDMSICYSNEMVKIPGVTNETAHNALLF